MTVEISTNRPVVGVEPVCRVKLSLAVAAPTLVKASPVADPTVGTAAELVVTALAVYAKVPRPIALIAATRTK